MQAYFTDNTLLWTQEIFDDWIKLFGTPNHYCYPDVPFSAAEANTLLGYLRLKTKVVSVRFLIVFDLTFYSCGPVEIKIRLNVRPVGGLGGFWTSGDGN